MAEYKIERLHESSTPLNVTLVNGDNMLNVKSVDFGGANVEFSGSSKFSGSTSLTSITNGTIINENGSTMFRNCKALQTFDCGLPNLKSGSRMFWSCSSLTEFNSQLPTLTQGGSMFQYCSSLTKFNVDMQNLTDGNMMFQNCRSLTSFTSDLSNLSDGCNMFCGCSSLTEFTSDLSNLTNGISMFTSCSSLTEFTSNLSNLTFGVDMFTSCNSLTSFTSDIHSIISTDYMFYGCTALKQVEMILPTSKSGLTYSDFSIPSTAPCVAYRYVEDLGDDLCKITFTDTEIGPIIPEGYTETEDSDIYISDCDKYALVGSSSDPTLHLDAQQTMTISLFNATECDQTISVYDDTRNIEISSITLSVGEEMTDIEIDSHFYPEGYTLCEDYYISVCGGEQLALYNNSSVEFGISGLDGVEFQVYNANDYDVGYTFNNTDYSAELESGTIGSGSDESISTNNVYQKNEGTNVQESTDIEDGNEFYIPIDNGSFLNYFTIQYEGSGTFTIHNNNNEFLSTNVYFKGLSQPIELYGRESKTFQYDVVEIEIGIYELTITETSTEEIPWVAPT